MQRLVFTILALSFCFVAGLSEDVPNTPPIPRGLPKLEKPADAPSKIELGRSLFSETKLSADGTVSCASCHDPQKNFATSDAKAIGIGKQVHRRNAPSLMNRAFGTSQFW